MLIMFTYDVDDMEKEREEEYTIEEDVKQDFTDFFDELMSKYK